VRREPPFAVVALQLVRGTLPLAVPHQFGHGQMLPPVSPLPAEQRIDAQRRPLALEPVRLDQTRLAAEAQALEQTPDPQSALVGLGEDTMYAPPLEQLCQKRRECLGRETLALVRPCQRDSDLGGRRLVGRDSHSAIPAHRARLALDDRQLQPLSALTE